MKFMLNKNKYCVRFFPVGEGTKGGDAILIELYDTDDNPYVFLIDGGYNKTGGSIIAYLKKKYENPVICMMINTHPDKDHLSGLKTILEDKKIEVEEIIMNRPWKDGGLKPEHFKDKRITPNSLADRIKESFSLADEIEQLASNRGIKIKSADRGKELILGVLTILGPSKSFYKKHLLSSDKTPDSYLEEWNKPYVRTTMSEDDYDPQNGIIEWFDEEETSEVNQTSLVILLEVGSEKFLFTGDAGKDALRDAFKYYEDELGGNVKDFTVIQLPHHGSRKNIDPELLERLAPNSFIISCPPDGVKEGHPSRRLINKILEINPNHKIYVTQEHNFLFHKGVEIKASPQNPQGINKKMDGMPN